MAKHYERLTAEERAAIMMMTANSCSARQIALTLRRAPSTITRELTRFAAWSDRPAQTANTLAVYDARAAGLRARRERFKCRKRSKLGTDTVLFGVVHHFLVERWSPAQIAGPAQTVEWAAGMSAPKIGQGADSKGEKPSFLRPNQPISSPCGMSRLRACRRTCFEHHP